MYLKILVPVDGSEASIHALNHGVELARIHSSMIQMVSVIDELKLPFGAQYSLWAQESHQELIRSSLESLNKEMIRIKNSFPGVMIDASIHEGDPAARAQKFQLLWSTSYRRMSLYWIQSSTRYLHWIL